MMKVIETDDRPRIDYPCPWEYRVIGESEAAVRQAVARVLGERAHEVRPSHVSGRGRYLSFAVEVEVVDDDDRLLLFSAFRAHQDIRWVL